jgi:hypothetical protein
MLQQAQIFEIDKRNLFLNLRQKDNILRQILAPPTASDVGGGNAANQATQTINLTNAQVSILGSQNALIGDWVSYQTQRLGLYADLGIMPYDEWEAFYELFPSKPTGNGNAAPGANARPPGPGAAVAPASEPETP